METATGRLISSKSITVDPKRKSLHWSSDDGSLVAILSRETSGQDPAEDILVVRVSDQKEVCAYPLEVADAFTVSHSVPTACAWRSWRT